MNKSKFTLKVMTAGILVAAVMCVPVVGSNFNAFAMEGTNGTLKIADVDSQPLLSQALSVDDYTDSEQQAIERASAVDKAKTEAEQSVQELKEKKEAEQAAAKAAEESTAAVYSESQSDASVSTNSSSGSQTVIGDATSTGYLLSIDNPDPNYVSRSVSLSAEDRYILERLVMGESGNQGFIGAALVAQTIRDTMVYDGYSSVEQVRTACGYYGSLDRAPNQDVLDAVSYIFDQGGAAVQHELRYFYAYKICSSPWHESQNHIVTYMDVKFFDRW